MILVTILFVLLAELIQGAGIAYAFDPLTNARFPSRLADATVRSDGIDKTIPSWAEGTAKVDVNVPPGDASRRNFVTGAGAAFFAIQGLTESFSSLETAHPAFSAVFQDALLEGDTIVRNLWLGRLAYPVLVVCLESGFFEALGTKTMSKVDVGRSLTPPVDGNGRIFESLTAVLRALQLIRVDGNRLSLTEAAKTVLLKNSPYFWGSQLLAADGVTAMLRKNMVQESRGAKVSYSAHSVQSIEGFIDSMQAHGSVTAKATAALPIWSSSNQVLDMAGGSGCFAKALKEANPHLTVTLDDLPPVIEYFHQNHPRSSIRAVSADLFDSQTWPSADVVLLANVL